MNSTGFVKCVGASLALTSCVGCAVTLRQAQGDNVGMPPARHGYQYVGRTLAVDGRLVTAARPPGVLPRYAAIVPDGPARPKTFEYMINYYGTYAGIFDYPKSVKEIGEINNVGGQGCTNVLYGYGKKTFWIVAAYNQIAEYAVPQKPIKTLSVSYSSIGSPSSCAMDTTGDLAVGILYGSGGGDVVIFKNASGTGTVYTTPMDEEFFDGYDNNGNLFADGFAGDRRGFVLAELRKGSRKFKTIATSNTVAFPGSVQWDGTYLTVLDQNTNEIYQYTVSEKKATLKGTVTLSGAGDCAQSWIVQGLVYCGDAGNDNGEVFKYPAGGSPIATFTGSFDFPLGVTAAEK
jgi:hypothetical protein